MVWQQWVYLGLAVFSNLATIYLIGRPRTTYTPPMAACVVAMSALITWMILSI
jgi:hypothetical protein